MATDAEIDLAQACERLVQVIASYGRVAVAFSGGVDSSVVARAAVLAGNDPIAITSQSPSVAEAELEGARRLAGEIGIRHLVIKTSEFDRPEYQRNDGRRCYYCKDELYSRILDLRETNQFDVVCSGANLDDLGDYRPGLEAAAEHGVRHPLQEAALSKDAVRRIAQRWGLSNWDKPASPCLSSRIAIGHEATPERVRQVELAEEFLRAEGFPIVRVRHHPGDHARIEVPTEQIVRLVELAATGTVVLRFKSFGFKFVSVDLEGFRSGSLNVLIPVEELIPH